MEHRPNASNQAPQSGKSSPHWLGHSDNNRRTHFRRRASAREYRREQVLREWLGRDLAVEEFSQLRPPPRMLGEVLPEVMASMGMQQADRLSRLRDQWVEIVGADVARDTQPCTVRYRVLLVEVSNPTWLFVLNGQHRTQIRQRLETLFPGEFKDVRFVPPGRVMADS